MAANSTGISAIEMSGKDSTVDVKRYSTAGDVEVGEPSDSKHDDQFEQGDFVTANEDRDLKRGLAQRHIQMIAIAGTPSLVT